MKFPNLPLLIIKLLSLSNFIFFISFLYYSHFNPNPHFHIPIQISKAEELNSQKHNQQIPKQLSIFTIQCKHLQIINITIMQFLLTNSNSISSTTIKNYKHKPRGLITSSTAEAINDLYQESIWTGKSNKQDHWVFIFTHMDVIW